MTDDKPERTTRAFEMPDWLKDAIAHGPPSPKSAEDARRLLWQDRAYDRERAMRRIPETYRDVPLPGLLQRCVPTLRSWATTHELPRGAVLLGPRDSGKSQACAIVLARRIRQACIDPDPVRWHHAQRFAWRTAAELERLRVTDADFRDEPEMLSEAKSIGLLVINDLGNASRESILGHVLDARYERKLPTLITSGCTMQELEQLPGPFAKRIFRQRGVVVPVVDLWSSP